jgi:protein phosphatase
MHIQSHGISDIGKRRATNEDVFAIFSDCGLYALADGMGGHRAGEVAAKMAIDVLHQNILSMDQTLPPLRRFLGAIAAVNQHVHNQANQRKEWHGMGSTLSCLLAQEGQLFYAHVGDSRIYRYREELEQLTSDHIQKDGLRKRKITRAIGASSTIDPEIGQISILPGDRFLICSDGLTDSLSDLEIKTIMEVPDLHLVCQKCIDDANYRGGHDNITVVILECLFEQREET